MTESQEVQQPTIKSSPFMSPMHLYSGSIITMTNPEDEIYKMELTFRGMVLGSDGKPKKVGEALMNEEGINSIVGIVQNLVSRDTVLSNFNKVEISTLMEFLGDTISKDLMLNRLNYNIINPSARDKIYFTACSTAFVTMKRAFEQGEKIFWKGSLQEVTTRVEGQQKKGGLLSQVMGWNK